LKLANSLSEVVEACASHVNYLMPDKGAVMVVSASREKGGIAALSDHLDFDASKPQRKAGWAR
jgi:hypothetical protein